MATTLVERKSRVKELIAAVVESENIVRETTNYDQFVYDPRNRPIDWVHVQELFDSVCENNLLADFPMVVESRAGHLIVLDGQHRLEVAKILECPIYYKISDKMKMEDVGRINGSTKGWENANYLNRWLREGKPEYVRYQAFTEKYPNLGSAFSMTLCMTGTNKAVRAAFRNGRYVCDNLDVAEKLGEAAKTIAPFAEGFATSTHFLVALKKLLDNPRYSHEVMLQKLSYQSGRLKKCADHKAYITLLLEIYSYKSRGPALTMDGVPVKTQKRTVEYA